MSYVKYSLSCVGPLRSILKYKEIPLRLDGIIWRLSSKKWSFLDSSFGVGGGYSRSKEKLEQEW